MQNADTASKEKPLTKKYLLSKYLVKIVWKPGLGLLSC
jgi:hypothetical protein